MNYLSSFFGYFLILTGIDAVACYLGYSSPYLGSFTLESIILNIIISVVASFLLTRR